MHAMKDVLGLWSILNLIRTGLNIQFSPSTFLLHLYLKASWIINVMLTLMVGSVNGFHFKLLQNVTLYNSVCLMCFYAAWVCVLFFPSDTWQYATLYIRMSNLHEFIKKINTLSVEMKAGLVPLSYAQLIEWQD